MLLENKMSTPPTVSDLQAQYKAKLVAYEKAVGEAVATNDTTKLAEIRALNEEISSLLEQMLTEVSNASVDTSTVKAQRTELVTTLNRIQRDYNGLVQNTDSLELLRRIREGTTDAPRKEFEMYLFFFLLMCGGILLLMFFGSQKIDATTISATTPPRIAPFV